MVFFEGNDIEGIQEEAAALEEYKVTGQRPYRNIQKQTSFLKFSYRSAENVYIKVRRRFARKQDAYFISKTGEIPVTLEHTPPGRDQLTPKQIELLDAAMSQYAQTARAAGITPWLVFMPSKLRAQYGCLRFTESTNPRFVNWRPTNLPELIEELATKHGVKFINVTPALLEAARNGILTFNPVWDTHLNREGSHIVAGAIAEELRRDENSR